MPSLTLAGIDRRLIEERYIRSTMPIFWADLSRRDGNQFISDDAFGYQMTVTGAIGGIQGRTFNGTSDNITIPLSLTPPYTLIVWAKISRTPSVRGLQSQLIDGSVVNTAAFTITVLDRVYFYNGSDILYAVPDPVLTNWHMFTAVVNGANSSITVDNGALVAGTMANQAITSLLLGENGANTVWLEGMESLILAYNRALIAQEIWDLFQLTKWRFI